MYDYEIKTNGWIQKFQVDYILKDFKVTPHYYGGSNSVYFNKHSLSQRELRELKKELKKEGFEFKY